MLFTALSETSFTMSAQGSPGIKNFVFPGRDKAAEVAKRRELQEKEREAK